MNNRILVLGLAAVVLTGAGGAPTPAVFEGPVTAPILPHRALYKLSLDYAKNGSPVIGVEGKMFYQLSDACNGWATEQRFDITFTYTEAEPASINTTYTTWESKDSTQYRFNVRRTTNGQLEEAYKGTATIPAPGKAGVANFVLPEKSKVDIPAGAFFPTAHTHALLAAANAHKPLFAATVFDGSEGKGLSEISAAITGRKAIPALARTGGESLPNVMWPMRMAFFERESQESVPEYEMETSLLPNGVTESMLLDYGEFRVKVSLDKVEPLPAPKC